MRSIEVEITGISPFLMHRFSEEDRAKMEAGSSHITAKSTPEETAERAAYRLATSNGSQGNLYVPSEHVLGCIRKAAAFRKIGRRSAVMAFCAGVFIRPERIDLGQSAYEIDARSVVNPTTRGRVMCYRPKLDSWRIRFTLEYNESIIPSIDLVRAVLDDGGAMVGIGSFRPEKKGAFGRFVVTGWK